MNDVMRSGAMGLALAATVLTALVGAPGARAITPDRQVEPAPDDMVITNQCAFPVLAHIDGSEISTIFFDQNQNPVKLIAVFPGNTVTLTNLDTGKSLTALGSTSSFHARAERDGSEIDMFVGQGWWPIGNPVTGEPGIWYQEGRVSATFDAQGNMSAVSSTGRLANLCPRLGS